MSGSARHRGGCVPMPVRPWGKHCGVAAVLDESFWRDILPVDRLPLAGPRASHGGHAEGPVPVGGTVRNDVADDAGRGPQANSDIRVAVGSRPARTAVAHRIR